MYAVHNRKLHRVQKNVIEEDKDVYKIRFAVPGYSREELNVTYDQSKSLLVISSDCREDFYAPEQYIYRGFYKKDFQENIVLDTHCRPGNVMLDQGILTIDVVNEIPESQRPQNLEIL